MLQFSDFQCFTPLATKPRNAILGDFIAGAIAVTFSYVPESILPPWVRAALAPAAAIAAISYYGVLHPPAGAVALMLAQAESGSRLDQLGFM